MKIRSLVALLLAAAIPAPAFARTHVIAELGTAPLIGQIDSTQQLQTDAVRNAHLFNAAGHRLGLTPSEYAQMQAQIGSKRLAYVTIPRHLDAMTWSSGGNVYVLHDVMIPAGTKGWEIDLRENHQVVALFIPAKCGNLSLLRRPLPAIAMAKSRPVAVEAAATAPPAAPIVAAAPAPAYVPPAAPAATPPPYQALAASTAPASAPAASAAHHFRLWPLLALPLLALIAGHGSVSSAPTSFGSTLAAPVAGCPTPAPSH